MITFNATTCVLTKEQHDERSCKVIINPLVQTLAFISRVPDTLTMTDERSVYVYSFLSNEQKHEDIVFAVLRAERDAFIKSRHGDIRVLLCSVGYSYATYSFGNGEFKYLKEGGSFPLILSPPVGVPDIFYMPFVVV